MMIEPQHIWSARDQGLAGLLDQRVVVMDGAMGTMIQALGLQPSAPGGGSPAPADLLNLTRPEVVRRIHADYLHAGADVVKTNTFNANSLALAPTGRADLAVELNRAGAALARDAAAGAAARDPARPRFVAGVLGPVPPGAALNRAAVESAYGEAAASLVDGGADLLLLETVTHVGVAAAAVRALERLFDARKRRWPVMISATLTSTSDRLPSGGTLAELWQTMRCARPLAVGLNCGFGAGHLRPHAERLAAALPTRFSLHPNAGLPNARGGYDHGPGHMAEILESLARGGCLNMVGGCCGTTPGHIRAIAAAVAGIAPSRVGCDDTELEL